MNCPFNYKDCKKKNQKLFANLGKLPRVDVLLSKKDLKKKEVLKPLKAFFCKKCFLVQHPIYTDPKDIFKDDYIYYSSTVKSWVKHCKIFVHKNIKRFSLTKNSFVVEVASNDGYLLQHFVKKKIPCLGIEPSSGVINEAKKKGVETLNEFYNYKSAKKIVKNYSKADLIVANNVLAHIPNLKEFILSSILLLKDNGIIAIEFPHLLNLIRNKQFDTIYDEHYFYFSLSSIKEIFKYYGLVIFDTEELKTHGGSLRIYVKKKGSEINKITPRINKVLKKEKNNKLNLLSGYLNFQKQILLIKKESLNFLKKQKSNGKKIIAFGAAHKASTFLNFCKINTNLISHVVDDTKIKIGKFMPLSRIPVVDQKFILKFKPDLIVILVWNLKKEVIQKLKYIRKWNGKFITFIPKLEIF